jgi:MoxR-like ATPase
VESHQELELTMVKASALRTVLQEAAVPRTSKTKAAPSAVPQSVPSAGVMPATHAKSKQMINIGAPSVQSRLSILEDILENMDASHNARMLLAGSTGIGKTQFVKQLAKLLGMELIMIEVPHITEEKVINIPFVVFDQAHPRGRTGHEVIEQKTDSQGRVYDIVMGKSYLATEIARRTKTPDAQYLRSVNQDPVLVKLWSELGGDDKTIPAEIMSLRKRFDVILFLDEYFRQTTDNVRNILRTILNRKIGTDDLPPNTYVIYASNMTDVGGTVERVPLNADMKKVQFPTPSKDEWFHYFVNRWGNKSGVKLKPEVVNAFYEAMGDQHISHDDLDTEIRTSPRRWEQVLLYVNTNTPVRDEAHAAALLANVQAQFSGENTVSKLHDLVDAVVRKIIKETASPEVAQTAALQSSDWRDIMQNQIETKMALGNARSYVPVVSGSPGIGKTSHMWQIAKDLNLRLILIDCSTISSEDATGIPIPEEQTDGMGVQFSQPPLYLTIMKNIARADQEYLSTATPEQKKAYEAQPYKYLLFFDELSRVKNATVFNALRRVILEKSFSDDVKLPDTCIMVAAMNPEDRGVVGLTGHMKDSVDLIQASASWRKFREHMDRYVEKDLSKYGADASNISLKILDLFVEDFSVKRPDAEAGITSGNRQFYLRLGTEYVYINPREMESMTHDIAARVARVIRKNQDTDPDLLKAALVQGVMRKVRQTVEFVIQDKHELDSEDVLSVFEGHVAQVFDDLLEKKSEGASLAHMLDTALADHSKHLKDDPNFPNMIKNFDVNTFTEELINYLTDMINAEPEYTSNALVKSTHPEKQFAPPPNKPDAPPHAWQVTQIPDAAVSKMEYVLNEIETAAKAHKVSSDVVDAIKKAMTEVFGVLMSRAHDDHTDQLLQKVDRWMT